MYRFRMMLWLAFQALRGIRTYLRPVDSQGFFDCDCPECLCISAVPFKSRLNQPPFIWTPEDKAEWDNDIDSYECYVLNNREMLKDYRSGKWVPTVISFEEMSADDPRIEMDESE